MEDLAQREHNNSFYRGPSETLIGGGPSAPEILAEGF
jgi:hypothetical protein